MNPRTACPLLALLLACTGGDKGAEPSPGLTGAGSFALTYLGQPAAADGAPPPLPSTTASYDLGTIKASRDFYFLLRNMGGEPITDIVLTSSGAAFPVAPGSIETLASDTDADFLPIIRLSAIHGLALDGYGTTDVLPMGTNTTTMTITGVTVDEDGDDESLELEVSVTVEAELMEVELRCDGIALDLGAPEGSSSSSLGGIGWLPTYKCVDGVAEMENTGNVDIALSLMLGVSIESTITLAPGDSATVADAADPALSWVTLQLDGANTIVDPGGLVMGTDGSAYLRVDTLSDEG